MTMAMTTVMITMTMMAKLTTMATMATTAMIMMTIMTMMTMTTMTNMMIDYDVYKYSGECGSRTEPGIFYDGDDLAWRNGVIGGSSQFGEKPS